MKNYQLSYGHTRLLSQRSVRPQQSIPVRKHPPSGGGEPPPEPLPLECEQAQREAVARAQEQARLQAAHEQSEKIKQAGRNRVWWSTGPAKRIVDRAGPHYATPDSVVWFRALERRLTLSPRREVPSKFKAGPRSDRFGKISWPVPWLAAAA
jgi:hypothetical protein